MLTTAVLVNTIVHRMTTTLAERLRTLREQGEVSGRELARLAGLAEPHISMIERGARPRIGAAVAEKIARTLGCSLDWLLLGQGEPPSADSIRTAIARARASEQHAATGTEG